MGTDFLVQFGCMLGLVSDPVSASYRSPKNGRALILLANAETVQTIAATSIPIPAKMPVPYDVSRKIVIKRHFDPTGITEFDKMIKLLKEKPENELVQLVFEYGVKRGVFRTDGKRPMGLPPLRYLDDGTDLNHSWDMVDPNFRPKSKPIRYPVHYESQIAEKCADYESNGRWLNLVTDDVIPTFCVPKKDPSKPRLVFDERQRNDNRVKDKTPLPNAQNIVQKAAEADWVSQADIIVAYEEARVRPDMERHTGFYTPWGIKRSRLGTMGDCNMP